MQAQQQVQVGGSNGSGCVSSILTSAKTSPAILERSTSNSSTGSSERTGSGTKKCVQFQLDNNEFLGPPPVYESEAVAAPVPSPSPVPLPPSSQLQLTQNQNQHTSQSDDGTNYHSGSIMISKNTSPFRPGGRGSKMLAKAIEEDVTADMGRQADISLPQHVLCVGKTPCFAKVMRAGQDSNTVFIQPMHRSGGDPQLLVPWEGHLWLAKRNRLMPVLLSCCCLFYYPYHTFPPSRYA